MNMRRLVDPELWGFVETIPPLSTSLHRLRELRALFAGNNWIIPEDGPEPREVTLEEIACPGPTAAPDLRVLLYQPHAPATGGRARSALIYLHGGGYVMGSADHVHGRHMRLAGKYGCVIAAVDYRLAPETAHPGPVEDCYAALAWLNRNAARLNIDSEKIGVMGESAGGGLAAALTLLARDREEFSLAFQILIYPMLDDRTCVSETLGCGVGQFIWTRETNRFGWSALLGREPGGEGIDCYAAAARAADLAGLPPAFIAVGTIDLFVDEDVTYARRLMDAGVPTELHVYPGAVHGFIMAAGTRLQRQLRRDYEAALEWFLR